MVESGANGAIDLASRVLVSRAAGLARAGDYAAADQLLAGLSTAPALDLRARVRAQQGHLGDAERFWQLATQLDPGQPAYRAGLRRIALQQSRPLLSWLVPARLLIAVLLLFVLMFLINRTLRTIALANSNGSPAPTQPVAGGGAVVAPPVSPPAPPALDLAIAGITVVQEAGELVTRFDRGLFDRGIDLRSGAEAMLAELARRIAEHQSPLRVRVVGGTDDVPVRAGAAFADNVALGFARALRVADRLRSAGVPHTAITVESAGAVTPGTAASPDDRARARTVTLRIAAASPGTLP